MIEAEIVPFNAPDPKCSFCRAPKSKVDKMLSGNDGHYICGACIAQAKRRLGESNQEPS